MFDFLRRVWRAAWHTQYQRGVAYAESWLRDGLSAEVLRRHVDASRCAGAYDDFDRGIEHVLNTYRVKKNEDMI